MPPTPDTTLTRAPHGRTFVDWSPDDLEAAEVLANTGSLRFVSELCWALLGDGRVHAALETRVKGLLRITPSWEQSGDRRRSGSAVKALEVGEDWYASHPEAALAEVASFGLLLGVGLGQYVWKRTAKGRWLPVLEPYDTRWLKWDTTNRRWLLETTTGEIEITPGDGRWLMYAPSCAGLPTGDQKPWMWGAWRACRKPWLIKDMGWDDWGHHGMVHGSPIRVGNLPDPTASPNVTQLTREQRRELSNDLANLGADASIVPPGGVKLELLEATARTWEMFPAQIDAASREVAIAITGQTSSTELNQSQSTGATLHGTVRQDLIEADAQTLSTAVHDQALTHWARINFGSEDLAPWPQWDVAPPADVVARGKGLVALAEGIEAAERTLPEGKVLDRAALYAEAGVPLKDAPPDAPPPPKPAASAATETP